MHGTCLSFLSSAANSPYFRPRPNHTEIPERLDMQYRLCDLSTTISRINYMLLIMTHKLALFRAFRLRVYCSDYFKTLTRNGKHFQNITFYKPMVRNITVSSIKLDFFLNLCPICNFIQFKLLVRASVFYLNFIN